LLVSISAKYSVIFVCIFIRLLYHVPLVLKIDFRGQREWLTASIKKVDQTEGAVAVLVQLLRLAVRFVNYWHAVLCLIGAKSVIGANKHRKHGL
jgi:hypothetical protein